MSGFFAEGQQYERDVVVAYLRRAAESYRRQAARARADSSQSTDDASRWEVGADAIEEMAGQIEDGRHIR